MALITSFSGIRGIYDKDLTESIAVKYAYSYLTFLRQKTKKSTPTIVIGMDTRHSGVKLGDVIMGILDCNMIDVGIAPTPAVEFAVRHFNADGGIIITASHNEPFWNGFKFLCKSGSVLPEKDMEFLIISRKKAKFSGSVSKRKIVVKERELENEYNNFALKTIGKKAIESIRKKKIKIVVDPNGGAGISSIKLLRKIGVDVKAVNFKNGEFNRAVEPNEESMFYLNSVIKETGAEFAAGFDCDADRVEILMAGGKMLSGNTILALATEEVLSSKNRNEKYAVVINDATSYVVRDTAKKYNAKIIETGVGEINVVSAMERYKAVIGGEGSSSGVILPPSKCRDGTMTLLMMLSIASRKSLHEAVNELPEYFTLRKKIEFNPSMQPSIRKHLKKYYSGKGLKIIENEGLKGSLKVITGKDSFVWFRASKTEGNIFRIMSDSRRLSQSEKLLRDAAEVFEKANQSK